LNKFRLFLTIILTITLVIGFALSGVKASQPTKHEKLDAKKISTKIDKKTEKETGEKEAHGETGDHDSESAEEESESAWRFFGWQTIFAILAVGYYISISLNLLPKFAATELEEKH